MSLKEQAKLEHSFTLIFSILLQISGAFSSYKVDFLKD